MHAAGHRWGKAQTKPSLYLCSKQTNKAGPEPATLAACVEGLCGADAAGMVLHIRMVASASWIFLSPRRGLFLHYDQHRPLYWDVLHPTCPWPPTLRGLMKHKSISAATSGVRRQVRFAQRAELHGE